MPSPSPSSAGRVLIVGESWMTHSIHQKGVDAFTTTEYVEGVGPLRSALESGGFSVDYQPAHVAVTDFPFAVEGLRHYSCILLSDIGANSLLLHPDTTGSSRARPNRVQVLADYVRGGGGLVMIGGYLTFQGIEAKGRWHGTAVEQVLPVTMSPFDDLREEPGGAQPRVLAEHEVLREIDGPWPSLLGYNRVIADEQASVLVSINGDPLLVVGSAGRGRTAAFTSDCAPHWAPPEFLQWAHYDTLWCELVRWTAGANESDPHGSPTNPTEG